MPSVSTHGWLRRVSVAGAQYGRDQVPMSKEVEGVTEYPPKGSDKGIKLLGFLPRDAVPRANFMKVRFRPIP